MEPSTPAPAKKSLKFLWILIPVVVLIGIGSVVFVYNTFLASTVSNFTDEDAGVDTKAIEDTIPGMILSIDSVDVTVGRDGLTRYLNVRLVLSKPTLTSDELWSVIHDAYEGSEGKVETIRIRAVDANNEPLDLAPAATEVGIQHLQNINSLTYSTATLKKAYEQ